jgi:hypothetical protein
MINCFINMELTSTATKVATSATTTYMAATKAA